MKDWPHPLLHRGMCNVCKVQWVSCTSRYPGQEKLSKVVDGDVKERGNVSLHTGFLNSCITSSQVSV